MEMQLQTVTTQEQQFSTLVTGAKLVLAGVAAFYANLGTLFPLLLGLIVLDIVSGILVAVNNGNLSSRSSWQGMTRKVLEILMVLMAKLLEPVVVQTTGASIDVSGLVAAFYCFHEGISILENCTRAGVPVPGFLQKVLDTQSRRFDDPLPNQKNDNV